MPVLSGVVVIFRRSIIVLIPNCNFWIVSLSVTIAFSERLIVNKLKVAALWCPSTKLSFQGSCKYVYSFKFEIGKYTLSRA